MSKTQTIRETEVAQTIETPIKTVDESLDVLDRITDNAQYNILPARYLLRDDEGNITEEPDELFRRVAQNVATAEAVFADDEYTEEEAPELSYDDVKNDYPEVKKWADEFTELMETLQWMPNSPTLMNAGADLQQLSACFVLEPDDDMDDIFGTANDAALIFKSGGGVGYAFHHLRPKGAPVASTGGVSSGPLSFMEVYNTTCGTVEQGGKRRGAQMGIMRIDHADVGRFGVSKRTEGDFDNFNISVGVTDEFVEAVKNDDTYTFYDPETNFEEPQELYEETRKFYDPQYKNNPESWEDDGEGELVKENFWRDHADTITPTGDYDSMEEKWGEYLRLGFEEMDDTLELPARFIWDIIIDGAWKNGEPGLFYYDETNRKHSFDVEEHPEHRIEATNPCAEQPLSEFEACNLGHINLSLMVDEDAPTFDEYDGSVEAYFNDAVDFESLDRVIESGTRFLDNVVTMSDFPLDEISERVRGQRKIGLGVMGWAQMLFQMGIPYGSDESYEMADHIMRHINFQSKQVSHSLTKERGVFAYWEDSKYANPTEYADWFEHHTYLPAEDHEEGFPIRNHNTTTVAPTGTTSMLGNTTGGIEPAYNVANFKNVGDDIQGDDMLVEFDDYFLRTLEANEGIDVDEIKEEAEELMRNNEFDGPHDLSIPDKLADVFVTTQDLTSRQHGLMQRVFQRHVDSGISKTVNLPNEATHDDVEDAYYLALTDEERGVPIKGLTVYRDGSRNEQVLTTRTDNKLDETDEDLHQTLEELYEADHLDPVAAEELGLEVEDEALCPDCGEEMENDGEGCTICPECFYSPCA